MTVINPSPYLIRVLFVIRGWGPGNKSKGTGYTSDYRTGWVNQGKDIGFVLLVGKDSSFVKIFSFSSW